MSRDIAAIAKKQQLLIVRIAAYHTRLEIDQVIIVHEFDDHRRVDIGYLDSVLDGIGRNDGAWRKECQYEYMLSGKMYPYLQAEHSAQRR